MTLAAAAAAATGREGGSPQNGLVAAAFAVVPRMRTRRRDPPPPPRCSGEAEFVHHRPFGAELLIPLTGRESAPIYSAARRRESDFAKFISLSIIHCRPVMVDADGGGGGGEAS